MVPMATQDKINATELWKRVLGELEIVVSPTHFKTFLIHSKAQNITNDSIEIICPNVFALGMMERQLQPLIQASVNKIGKANYKLIFKIGKVEDKKESVSTGPLFESAEPKVDKKTQQESGLYSKFSFENYVMGPNNQLAYAIATAVAQNPGKVYNPFFLYSGVGLGKTHLMQAIGNRILQEKPELKVIYCTGESFTNELIEAIQSARGRGRYTTNIFREKYRKVDILLIDDVQFIAGREATQEEFFHTFNALHMAQKQIVLTSDRPPKDFTNLEDRITSRFRSGIISDIQQPDLDMRIAILRRKRNQDNDKIPNNVIDFIAIKVDTNIRELEGAYLQVLTYASTTGEEISEALAAKALGQLIQENTTKPINLNQILKAVCNYYSVKMGDIKGKRRTKDLVIPRQMAMYLIHDLTETPYMSIGEFLGGRDHTTVIHGVRKVENEIIRAPKTKQDVHNIKQIIHTH